MFRSALRFVLATSGVLLARASRRAEFRAALSRPCRIVIESDDGVERCFSVRERVFYSEREAPGDVDFRLSFATSREALKILLAKDGLEPMVEGIAAGRVRSEGSMLLFVWFQGRLDEAHPLARLRRRRRRFPGAYTTPRNDLDAAAWIHRDAVVDALDPTWTDAHRQREKLLLLRVAAGERAPEF